MPNATIPVSVLTGFLGAGKTTLLNRILADPALTNTAVIINEFGAIGLDHLFVETVDEGIIELSSGCLCCTIRGDLVETLNDLEDRVKSGAIEALDRIVIETTGLADPAPILQTILQIGEAGFYGLDGVVTLVDAVNGEATLDAHKEALRQVAVADRIVVSKTDLVPTGENARSLMSRLWSINRLARVFDAQKPDSALPDALFRTSQDQMTEKAATLAEWLGDEQGDGHHHFGHHHHDINRHDDKIQAFALSTDEPVPSRTFQMFVDLLRSAHGPKLLRVKGIVRLEEKPETPLILHGVQHVFHPPVFMDRWPDADHRTRLVFITHDLDEAFVRELFDAFVGKIATDRPDRTALTENPLSVPGSSGPFRPS